MKPAKDSLEHIHIFYSEKIKVEWSKFWELEYRCQGGKKKLKLKKKMAWDREMKWSWISTFSQEINAEFPICAGIYE